ncbi:UTP--glucose-1-phosphate uridylyltransferase GalU [Rhodospirillum rubrum]|uniref:UTP--glucose-1-phosphate uridylyltransferase n=1 Tax=Rhodospirillum rubrum (strain ATCC 11170 / ATH 1.1.1 / DSM 467 / LMG 4362 / NCIMB 8255 / S1) TaxID=269796 RepID=Q2RSH8_RHORT|nr:UTP--glucose-1-phosphate uridylyltransferase GalU [Rhodospirillum rubrum]ABC22917.1 UDP-glucose pyrophosphorylase [Rhodospirillum rubrum ATCC 11170]MBK1664060.1 UTP--glucose-1-phosphate uridylyltransferase [Rhodospirillum rubrum]MBK1675464.1 UTP--glucose-1-phosphate uridylyltransferase [Rhodospirillum rubrum]MBK5954534.1 UTP--glucose-1-phosphate uridylyltransferase [Rhodospirillum rubrum]QXG78903.1 UTP--glucose-1-phosphate uridylyltransferase GalU [Rhodospirillum rubrum]
MSRRVRKAVFPVAGMGTRFLPATKTMAKEMLPVVDKPLIQYAVEEAAAAGIDHFIFITGRGKSVLMDHFDHMPELEALLKERGKTDVLENLLGSMPSPGKVFSTRQQQPLGLGHAVWCARAFIGDEPFAVLLPDDLVLADTPCIKQLIDAHAQTGGNVVAVEDVPRERTNKYGILDVVEDNGTLARAKGLVEKPDSDKAPSTLAIIGRYVLDPGIFDLLENQNRGAGGEIQLTDAMNAQIKDVPFHGLRYEGARYDCGDKVGFLQANIAFALERPDMRDAVKAVLADFAKTI